jgi:hypothetical protein
VLKILKLVDADVYLVNGHLGLQLPKGIGKRCQHAHRLGFTLTNGNFRRCIKALANVTDFWPMVIKVWPMATMGGPKYGPDLS